ncbi:hypothetical protein VZG28_04870 [Synechococcus elongatus IITB4]|uniref:hypothetical protein n=1 Tax=Synechococcus elongatus TaxID=32046 RepID=UPI0030D1B506
MTVCNQYTATIVNGIRNYPDFTCTDDSNVEFKVTVPPNYVELVKAYKRGDRITFYGVPANRPDQKGRPVVRFVGFEQAALVPAVVPSAQPQPQAVVVEDVSVTYQERQGLSQVERQTIQAIANDLLDIALDMRSRLLDRGVHDSSERIALLQSSLSAARDHVVGRAAYGNREYR